MAFSSSHAFSISRKALQFHRCEPCSLQKATSSCFIVTIGSSPQFKRDSNNYVGPFIKNDAMCMGMRNPSTSAAQMFPYHPNQISKGKSLPERLVRLHRVEEEMKQSPRYLHNQPVSKVKVIPPHRPSDFRTPAKPKLSFCTHELQSKDIWFEESIKLKEEKCRMRLEIPPDQTGAKIEKLKFKELQDGGAYEKLEVSSDSFSNWRSDDIVETSVLQNSFIKGYTKLDDQQALRPLLKHATDGETCYIKRGCKATLESRLTASNELDLRGHKSISADNLRDPTLDHSTQTVQSVTQIAKKGVQSNGLLSQKLLEERKMVLSRLVRVRPNNVAERNESNRKFSTFTDDLEETYIEPINPKEEHGVHLPEHREKLSHIYDKVLVVDDISVAKGIVRKLTMQYKHLVHACDTEVAKIDVKQETPVDHGELICFSIYSGPEVDFGNGKSCIWVDILDGGGRDLLVEFAPFFEDPSIKKVWHNYSFDNHVLENYGLKVAGFHADTMHMARLWDSSRRLEGGYSLEALTSDPKVMSGTQFSRERELIGKISMKTIFGKRKVKKDGYEGKLIIIAPVEELQREERIPWICYSALDSISTLKLFMSLKRKLMNMEWILDGFSIGSMHDFYQEYWQPFGNLLVKMETVGMLVDRGYLAEIEKEAILEQQVVTKRFRQWASRYCPDAMYMNVGSDAQLRQLFFGGIINRKDPNESLTMTRTFKVPNVDKVIEEGKKVPLKFHNIRLHNLGAEIQTDMYTATGWPSVSGDALKILAGRVSAEHNLTNDAYGLQPDDSVGIPENLIVKKRQISTASGEFIDTSAYGTAYAAFGGGKEGRNACHAIAALCEVRSIDSLISNFILPLQGSHISGKNGRVHCSLNINTETGRLSARRPNLQNQPALEKVRYKIRQAFIAAPGNSLIVADYGQLELRILAHLANCKSMLEAFRAGGDFHSRTAMNMYPHILEAVNQKQVLLEWYPVPGEQKPPVPLLKDAFASERRKAKMLNFSIAYGKTPIGLARDWKVSVKEAKKTVNLWYKERQEILHWQAERKQEAHSKQCVHTLLGRTRWFPLMTCASSSRQGHIERAAINTPVQGSAADVAMCAMLEISRNARLKELGWRLLLQVHDEVILEGPSESAEVAKAIVVQCMSKPFYGTNFLKVDLSVDAKCEQNWYAAK